MAGYFEDGFESGDYSEWDGISFPLGPDGTMSITSDDSKTGVYSAKWTKPGTGYQNMQPPNPGSGLSGFSINFWILFRDLNMANGDEFRIGSLTENGDMFVGTGGGYIVVRQVAGSIGLRFFAREDGVGTNAVGNKHALDSLDHFWSQYTFRIVNESSPGANDGWASIQLHDNEESGQGGSTATVTGKGYDIDNIWFKFLGETDTLPGSGSAYYIDRVQISTDGEQVFDPIPSDATGGQKFTEFFDDLE